LGKSTGWYKLIHAIMHYIKSIRNSFFEKYCLTFMLWFGWLVQDSFNNLRIPISNWSTTRGPQTRINMDKKVYIKGSFFFLNDCGILHDKLLAIVLYFFDYVSHGPRESKSSMGRRLYHERARGVNLYLFRIYNIDFWQYGWLYPYINSN